MKNNNIQFTYSFFDKFSIVDKLYNCNDLIIKSKDSEQLFLMKQIQIAPQQYEETLATFQYQKKLSHEQLLSVKDYYAQLNHNKIIVLFEYCCISLKDQFDNRLAENRYFLESQLWSIFTSLTFGLTYLQNANVGHGSVSLLDCFLNQQGFIKISDPTCATSNPYTILPGYFYSPQILRCLINFTKEEINIFKSDVFALGCCMLQLTLMKDISLLFDYENGLINKVNLLCALNELDSLKLSKQYIGFINEMLLLDHRERPDFIKLQSQIFTLMQLDKNQYSAQLKRSCDIKSSISSLCHQKYQINLLKQPIHSYQQLFNNKSWAQKKYGKYIAERQQSSSPLRKIMVFQEEQQYNRGKKKFQKRMQSFFGDLQQINGKYKSDQIKQISETFNTEQQNKSNSSKYLQFGQKKKRKRQKGNKTTTTIGKDDNDKSRIQSESKILGQLNNSYLDYQKQGKGRNLTKQSQLFSYRPDNKENSYRMKISTQLTRNASMPKIEQSIYTDSAFLKMLQADVKEIIKRRNHYV